ncbi:MAG: hypothetical protein ACO2OS_04405 [Thermosphaera aggregans]
MTELIASQRDSRVGMSYYFDVAQAISTHEKVKTYAERGYS